MLSVALLGTQNGHTGLSSKHFSYGLAHESRHSQMLVLGIKYFIIEHTFLNQARSLTNISYLHLYSIPLKILLEYWKLLGKIASLYFPDKG